MKRTRATSIAAPIIALVGASLFLYVLYHIGLERYYICKLTTGRPNERQYAAERLSVIGSRRALPLLIDILNTNAPANVSEHFCGKAIVSFGNYAVPLLVEEIRHSRPAGLLLFDLKPENMETLLEFCNDTDAYVRRVIIDVQKSKADLCVPESYDCLIARLSDPEIDIALAAAVTLQQCPKNSDAARTLVALFESHMTSTLSTAILIAIVHLDSRYVGYALDLLHDPNSLVRGAAALALGVNKVSAAVPAICRIALDPAEVPLARNNAISALGDLGPDKDIVHALILVLLSRPDPTVIQESIYALVKQGGYATDAIPALLMLSQADPTYNDIVNWALVQIKELQAEPPVGAVK
jgi:HEAT repeat protein